MTQGSGLLTWFLWNPPFAVAKGLMFNSFSIIIKSSNGNIFRGTGPWEVNPPVTGGFLSQKASDTELWWFIDVRPNKRLSNQSAWRHFTGILILNQWQPCKMFGDDIYISIEMWVKHEKHHYFKVGFASFDHVLMSIWNACKNYCETGFLRKSLKTLLNNMLIGI